MPKNFMNAVQSLTIVSMNKKQRTETDFEKSMVYFPVIGFLIGLILIYVDQAFRLLAFPEHIGNFLLITFFVILTRALPIEGLANTFEGIARKTRQIRPANVKEGSLGSFGVLAIVIALLLKYLCLNSLVNSEKIAALLIVPMLSRWSQTIVAYQGIHGREEEIGRVFVGHLRASRLVYSSLIAISLTAFVIWREEPRALFLIFGLIGGVILFTLMSRFCLVKKLGMVTHDGMGAISEANEVLIFLLFIILAPGH
ncbi:MAG: adenosylcobinamide-GDP ribazoletransferase [Nitrospirota bacterium]